MPRGRYRVSLSRTAYYDESAVVYVDANSEEEAEQLAYEMRDEARWRLGDCYDVSDTTTDSPELIKEYEQDPGQLGLFDVEDTSA